jgi:Fic-DOC domain mobile mystery protein B
MGLKLSYEPGQTPLDESEMDGLKIRSITTQEELNQLEQANIEKALVWILSKKRNKEEILSENFIKTLHKKMYSDVWKWAGEYRKTDKNIGVKWFQIAYELKILLDDTHFWINNSTFDLYEIALRFKHRLVSIHCFANGNGRHSRVMADLLTEQAFDLKPLQWNRHNLIKANEHRKNYINALQKADNGDYTSLISFAKEG